MALKVKTKILLTFVLLVVTASVVNIGIAGFTVTQSLTSDLINRIVLNTKSEINDLTNFILIGDKESIIDRIYNQRFSRKDLAYILVLDEQDKLISSTLINKDPNTYISYNTLSSEENEKVVLITTEDGEEVYDIALRLDYDKGILRAGYYKKQIDSSVSTIVQRLIFGAIFAVGIAVLFAFVFTKILLKPLDNLKDAVREIAKGDLSVRAEITSKDEIGDIALAFNDMAEYVSKYTKNLEAEVKERTTELEKTKIGLEKMVEERTVELEETKNGLEKIVEESTKQLSEKLKEAEEMNTLMVGRELKMIELKDEIAKLKGENRNTPDAEAINNS